MLDFKVDNYEGASGRFNANQKSRHFWKFAHEGLAVKTNLHKRIPQIPNLCPRCSSLPETHLHALIFCSGVVQVWNQSPVTSVIPRDPTMEPWEWWCQLMEAVRRRRDSKEKIS
ncbi:hypothetical protein AHAS_Ahas14G0127900 [Arachis hypogaea]